MPVLETSYSEYLIAIGQCYLGLGYSVLPVYGDLDIQRAKVCPIPWTYFQRRRATHVDLRNWFARLGFGGLAIVTGRISSLIALDFDDRALAEEFAQRFPDLTETWTVRSGGRKLPHYYFRLPPALNIASRRRDGVDLQSGGRYIVAPPTSIAGNEWRVLRGVQPKMLTEHDLRRISSFIGAEPPDSLEKASDTPLFAFLSQHNIGVRTPASRIRTDRAAAEDEPMGTSRPEHKGAQTQSAEVGITDADKLSSLYLRLVPRSRNEALFEAAIWARDHGWHKGDVKLCLVELHVRTRANREHCAETPEQRRKEAIRTIESAYSRPPRVRAQPPPNGIVSNAVREALLKRRQTAALRVLEALALAGWQPGSVFTEREARETARLYAVGEWSVRKALRQTQLFELLAAKTADTAKNAEKPDYKKCFFVTPSKPPKIPGRGRPVRYYMMPDQKTLCAKLGIQPAPASRPDVEDLRSCRTYRQSILRDLIKRRPGRYSRDWLADFLGVSVTTTRRYTHDLSVTVTPTYYDTLLLWRNVDSLVPPDIHDARPGSFLEDSDGKRYPPLRPVARRLLRKSRCVWFKWRGVNHYGYATNSTPQPAHPAEMNLPTERSAPPVTAREEHLALSPPQAPLILAHSPHAEKPPPEHIQPLADSRLEEAARRIYESMALLDNKRTLSLANARALVTQYGAYAVENTVEKVKNRSNVRNPAGFLIQLLASQYGFMTEDSLTIAEIYAAERAFLVTREINPKRALSWKKACELAREYGQVAIENAIKVLRQRRVENPAGFLIKLLHSEPTLGNVSHGPPDEQFVEHVYSTLRAMNPQRALSRAMIRRIIAARGRQAVTDALHLIKQRGNIQNPAGFLITLLRAQDVVRKHT